MLIPGHAFSHTRAESYPEEQGLPAAFQSPRGHMCRKLSLLFPTGHHDVCALGAVSCYLDFGDLRQKLAAEPVIESKDLLNYTENRSPAETEPEKRKQTDHLFVLALQARVLAGEA